MLELLQHLEANILLWIQDMLRSNVLDSVFIFYTKLGDAGLLWIVLSALMLVHPKTRKAGALALAAMLLGLVCTNLFLKPLLHRTRPWLVVEGLTALVVEHDPHSFPSGHTCAAFAAASAWWHTVQDRRFQWAALVSAVLMGFSRLYVGVHFPTDVLAGACVGCLCGWMAWVGFQRLSHRLPQLLR